MKKLFMLAAALVALQASAQFPGKRGFLSVSTSVSAPLGGYAAVAGNDRKDGAAKTGLNINYAFGYRIGKNLGITTSLFQQWNGYDINGIIATEQEEDPGYHYEWSATSYKITGLMIGPMYSGTINEKWVFTGRFTAGLFFADSPEVTSSVYSNSTGYLGSLTFMPASVLAYGFGLGAALHYRVSQRMSINGNLDYLNSSFEFPSEPVRYSNGHLGYIISSTIPFEVFNVGVGVSFIF